MTVCKRNGVNLNNAIKVAAISAVMSVLAACGDDSSTQGTEPTDSDVIAATFDDLPACSEKRQGAVGYVKDKKITYVCEDGKWVSDGEDSSSLNHCVDASEECDEAISSSKAKSSSSRKTSSSSLESKAKSSSSVKINSSSSKIKSSSSSGTKEGASTRDTISVTAIKNKSVSGVSQKGPFVTGSTVKLYELDGKTYTQTGKSFTGKIASDDGKFSVSSVTLASQYALLEANGYFRNEVTGKKSSGTVTLNALTDLSAREKVNVNLLTHLEYERALYLVGTGVNVSAAKKQAEAEIFNAFGIQGDFANSEDLDIFSKGEGNAALLAFSVLMLRDLSEADLTELLTKFAIDIEKDGKWNDEATKAKIADWAQSKDVAGTLAYIRSNIEKWNLGTVPEFEKFVRNFWYTNYGLGGCDKAREGEVIAAKNELSSTYGTQSRFICKSDVWVVASDIEKDTYKWASGKDGEIKTGDVTKTKKYDYDAKIKKWRDATTVEAALGGCTETREADISLNTGKVNGIWYICKGREWQFTNNITVDTQGWIKGSDGDLQKGDSTDVMYKYDEALGTWVTATKSDTTLKLMGCTTNRAGEIGKSSTDDTYYVCKSYTDSWNGTSGYDWQKAQEIDYDTYGEKCTSKEVGKTIAGVVTSTNKYYCMAEGWVNLMGDWSWNVPKEARLNPEIAYGTMTDSRDGKKYKTVTIGDQIWMAENLNYADSAKTPSLKGKSWCFGNDSLKCGVTGRLYTWAAAIDSVKLATDVDNSQDCGYGKTCTLPAKVQGVCPPDWHLPTYAEWNALFTAAGGQSTAGKVLKSQSGWYNNGNGTDAFGFSALPAGYKYYYGDFDAEGGCAFFWSSSDFFGSFAFYVKLYDNSEDDAAYLNEGSKNDGFSVRCLKD